MAKFKNKYRIESNRFRYWDYSSPGLYFITICTKDRVCFLGRIENAKIMLSEYGNIVNNEIQQIHAYHSKAQLNRWIIMPNHIHMIIKISNCDAMDNVEKIHEFSLRTLPHATQQPWWHNPDHKPTNDEIKQYRKQRRKMIIPKIIGKFKMKTSKQINLLRKTPQQTNWQPNYHDHIIRNEKSYQNISNYIMNNPIKWNEDTFNPKNPNADK